jgi:hypothetical protein
VDGTPTTRTELERLLAERAGGDPAFRDRLEADPKAAVAELLGRPLPDALRVHVLEQSATDVYLVLPPRTGTELSEDELDAIAGGASPDTAMHAFFF